jgi:hypothetical protein
MSNAVASPSNTRSDSAPSQDGFEALTDREKVTASFEELKARGIFATMYEGGCLCRSCSGPRIVQQGSKFYGITEAEWETRLDDGTLRYVILLNERDTVVQEHYEIDNCVGIDLDCTSAFDDFRVDSSGRYLLDGDESLRSSAGLSHSGDVFEDAREALASHGFDLIWDGDQESCFELSKGGGDDE